MAKKESVKKQTVWFSLIIQLFAVVLITAILYQTGADNALLFAIFIYIFLSFFLKRLVPLYQTKGVALVRAGLFKAALQQFLKSYQFFKKYQWLDKYRALFLLTVNNLSYTEMALLNAAFCYGRIGEKQKSKETYEEVLRQFPQSERALMALKNLGQMNEE